MRRGLERPANRRSRSCAPWADNRRGPGSGRRTGPAGRTARRAHRARPRSPCVRRRPERGRSLPRAPGGQRRCEDQAAWLFQIQDQEPLLPIFRLCRRRYARRRLRQKAAKARGRSLPPLPDPPPQGGREWMSAAGRGPCHGSEKRQSRGSKPSSRSFARASAAKQLRPRCRAAHVPRATSVSDREWPWRSFAEDMQAVADLQVLQVADMLVEFRESGVRGRRADQARGRGRSRCHGLVRRFCRRRAWPAGVGRFAAAYIVNKRPRSRLRAHSFPPAPWRA
jgi:hypothetical protein